MGKLFNIEFINGMIGKTYNLRFYGRLHSLVYRLHSHVYRLHRLV
ncbi:hypothetical protein [Flavobacterium humi]|nr:hypothetical protein [Flavobacterium humi]